MPIVNGDSLAEFEGRARHAKAPKRDPVTDTGNAADLVTGILNGVRTRGDAAVHELSLRFDKNSRERFKAAAKFSTGIRRRRPSDSNA